MASDDQILLTFGADVASYEKVIDRIEQKTLGLQTAADGVNNRVSNIGKGAAFKPLQDGLKQTTQEMGKLRKETESVSNGAKEFLKQQKLQQQEIEKSKGGFLALRKELKATQGQLATLAEQGKTGSKEFKDLSARAGELQDQMNDLGETIKLQSGPPIENFTSSLGDAKNALLSLDFDKVSRGLGIAGQQISKISFKDMISGLQGALVGVGKLAAALISSPIFLVGAAVATIIARIVTWGDTIEEVAARNDKAVDKINAKLETTTAGYDRQIKVLQSLGKDTLKIEDDRARAIVRSSNEALDIRKRELESLIGETEEKKKLFKELAESESTLIKTAAGDRIKRTEELNKKITELEQQRLNAIADIQALTAERQKKADEEREAAEKAAYEKAKAEREKRNAEILAAQRALQQSQINLITDSVTRQRAQIEFDFRQRIDAIKGNSDAEIKLRESLALERDAALRKIGADAAKNEAEDIKSRQAFVLPAIRQLTEAETQILLDGARTRAQIRAEEAASIAADIAQKAAFGNSIVEIGQAVTTLISENQAEAAERNKLFASFGIGLNLATSLSQMIAGATAAAAATGPLAPFTLVAYIAQGFALVTGAFAQIKSLLNAPVPKGAAHGEEFVNGKARGRDTEHYMLAHGERVVTSAVNEKYWDVLHAMHTGNERAILPALRKALGRKSESDNESFASNIANSLMLSQGWKGGNIVDKLGLINQSEEKRHSELLRALTPRSTQRKK